LQEERKNMRFVSAVVVLVAVSAAFGFAACKSEEPVNPYAQGYPQGYPQGVQQAYPQVPVTQPQQQPAAQPTGQPAANPLAGLAALGQAMGGMAGQPAGQPVQAAAPTALVPWQSLAQALPTAAGWTMQGQVEGESVNVMGIAASTTRCDLAQGAMTAHVEIVDNAMAASMAAMGFSMLGNMSSDTNEGRTSRVNFGTYPGMQNFQKQSNSADVTIVVGNRIMVTVKVQNAGSETPALQLAQAINFAHLASLIGG
jgi:hypothetical protein